MADKKIVLRGDNSRTVIGDIAKKSGVSITTVSRVLNNRPDVSDATREKVMTYIRELGYVTNRHARALVSGHISYIGFMVPVVEQFSQILQGASDALEEYDAHVVIYPTRHERDREITLLEHLQNGGTDGALLILPTESPEELAQLNKRHYPFVVVDPRHPLGDDIATVSTANMAGARTATEHLLRLGHQRIAVITGYSDWSSSIDRLVGHQSMLFSAGLPNRPELIYEGDYTFASGYDIAQQILALPERPTAVFAFNDAMAIGLLRAAQERGIRVPEELSIMGFDDIPYASYVTPPLTTVRQPTHELGRTGINLLFRILEGQTPEALHMQLSTRLVIRASTGPCPPD